MPKKGETKVTHLTNKQMDDVLSAVYRDYNPQDPMYVGILLVFYAGLRRGELCGLRWNDIDFYKHTITVRSAVGVSNGDALGDYTKSPKNKSSNRTFPMVEYLEKALLDRKKILIIIIIFHAVKRRGYTNQFNVRIFAKPFINFFVESISESMEKATIGINGDTCFVYGETPGLTSCQSRRFFASAIVAFRGLPNLIFRKLRR